MTLLLPVYRATVYAPKSTDATETTVLTPIAGAPHTDAFKIATAEGVFGFKSYMGMPSGRRGRIDVLSKKTDIGQLGFDVLDQRTTPGGSNAQRWVTAFIGDNRGLVRFVRLKCFVEESLYGLVAGTGANGSYTASGATTWTTNSEVGRIVDLYDGVVTPSLPNGALVLSTTVTSNTATTLTFTGNATSAVAVQVWAPFFMGRCNSLGLKGGSRTQYVLSVKDMADDLTYQIFTGRPHGNVYQTTERIVLGAQTSTTLKDTSRAWIVNQWAGTQVTITKATGVGQRRTVISNTADTLTVPAWTVTPDATSFYSFGYAQLVSVCPVGFVYPYGGVDAGGRPLVHTTKPLDGKIGQVDATNGWAQLNLDRVGPSWVENILNSSLYAGVVPTTVVSLAGGLGPDLNKTLPPQFTGVATARVVRKDTGAEGDFQVGFIMHETVQGIWAPFQVGKSQIVATAIRPLSYPLGVATGAPQANGAQGAAPTAATSAVTMKGWTISITGILVVGDVVSFAGHGQRYLVVASANSDGSGNATVTLKPGLQAAVANSEVITVQTSPNRMALPPTTTAVSFSITCDMRLADGGNSTPIRDSRGRDTGAKHYLPGNLLLVNDVHPAQLLKDVLLGWYGRLYQPTYNAHSQPSVSLPPSKNLGDPWRTVSVMNTDPVGDGRHGFNALIADATFPSFRCIVDQQLPINEFIEKYICQPYGIGYYFDGAGNFVPVDMRQPAAAIPGIVTITDADLKDDAPINWSYDGSSAIAEGMYTIYAEGIIQPIAVKIQVGDTLPVITTKMFDVQGGQIIDTALGNPDLSIKQYQIDGHGFRAMPNEVGFRWQNGANVALQSRWNIIQQAIVDIANRTVKRPYGNGLTVGQFTALRNANTANLFPCSFCVLNVAANVDPTTNTRGPARLVLITERSEDQGVIRFTALDWGLSTTASIPIAVGNPANLAGDTAHSQTCVATTLNAQNEAVEAWINVTSTAVGTRPADSDPNWTFVGTAFVSGWTVTARHLPTGARVYWRWRTSPQRDTSTPGQDALVSAMKLPSQWVYPAVDHADLSTMSGPSGLGALNVTANSFTVTWTPADVTRIVEIWLAKPVAEARQRIAVLPLGATRYDFTGLGSAATYRVAVREIDGPTGGFAETTIDVTTTSSAPTVQPPIGNRGGGRLLT